MPVSEVYERGGVWNSAFDSALVDALVAAGGGGLEEAVAERKGVGTGVDEGVGTLVVTRSATRRIVRDTAPP
jgi:hypothetical protein